MKWGQDILFGSVMLNCLSHSVLLIWVMCSCGCRCPSGCTNPVSVAPAAKPLMKSEHITPNIEQHILLLVEKMLLITSYSDFKGDISARVVTGAENETEISRWCRFWSSSRYNSLIFTHLRIVNLCQFLDPCPQLIFTDKTSHTSLINSQSTEPHCSLTNF